MGLICPTQVRSKKRFKLKWRRLNWYTTAALRRQKRFLKGFVAVLFAEAVIFFVMQGKSTADLLQKLTAFAVESKSIYWEEEKEKTPGGDRRRIGISLEWKEGKLSLFQEREEAPAP